jgi:hypothetical protein
VTLERRMQALLDLVDGDRSTHCAAILDEARARAATLGAQARADARVRMREAFTDERRRAHERVAAATAKLQTRRRLHEQQRAATLLALGWQQLPEALRRRWHDADARREWVDAVITAALFALPRKEWQVLHAADWPEAERQAAVARLQAELDAPPACVAGADIPAGIKIAAGGNIVDGTLAGLTSDRSEVGARLLRHLEQAT